MNTTTTTTTPEAPISSILLAVPLQLNIWLGTFFLIIGNLNCIGNMIVFRSRAFRGRSYSIYLFLQAMWDFFYLNSVLVTRILQRGYQISVTGRFDSICKIRQFMSFFGNQISFTLFTLATIDRLLSTQRSQKYRQWSNRVPLAYKMSIGSLVFWFICIGHRLILYSAQNGSCSSLAGFYNIFDNYLEFVFGGICPPIVTSILAYLLIKSVRSVINRRIAPESYPTQSTLIPRTILQQMDTQLTRMLMLESIITITTYGPYAIELIYSNATQYLPKSALRKAQERVFVELIRVMSYGFFISSFYVSIISNVGFRRQIKKFFCKRQENEPTGTTRIGTRHFTTVAVVS